MNKLLFSCILSCLVSSCTILPERPAINYYGINVSNPTKNVSKASLGSIRINTPTVASPFDSSRFYIKTSGNRYYQSDSNRFVNKPSEFIGESLRQWIENQGRWSAVLSPNSTVIPDYQMIVYVSELFADTSVPTPVARISVEISIVKTSTNKLVFHQNFTETKQIKADTPSELVNSYSEGLTSIYQQLSKVKIN